MSIFYIFFLFLKRKDNTSAFALNFDILFIVFIQSLTHYQTSSSGNQQKYEHRFENKKNYIWKKKKKLLLRIMNLNNDKTFIVSIIHKRHLLFSLLDIHCFIFAMLDTHCFILIRLNG